MVLPNGISSFLEAGSCLEILNVKKFKNISYCLANENYGKILSIDISLYGKNFYISEILTSNIHCYFLMNVCYPYTAFASSVEYGLIKFIDKPIKFVYPYSEHNLLGKEALSDDWRDAVENLNCAELTQIKYWKPTSIGEIIFNFWD